jgi:outer membrane protein assembly factor BamD
MFMRNIGLLFTIALFTTACSNNFNKILKSKDNELRYKAAEKFYAEKKYEKAQILYDDLFPANKGTARFEDMYYKFAYCSYYQKDYLNAENLFKNYVENFPNGPRAEECEYMRAYSFYKQSPKVELDQTNTTKTMGLMQTYVSTHPNGSKVGEATAIIDGCRLKLEDKEFKAAELYYNLGYYKAAAIAYASVIDNYPDSDRSDMYKLQAIKAYAKYADMSVPDKQEERYGKVISECSDFAERFPDSKFAAEVAKFKSSSINNIKNLKNEQIKTTTQR